MRWHALGDLWRYRDVWRQPPIRQAMRAERDKEIADMVPVVVFIAVLVAVLIFVVLPNGVGEQAVEVLRRLWPWWVVQAAPLICALAWAALNAPGIALKLTECEARGEFSGGVADAADDMRSASVLAARLCVPIIVAHAAACLACTVLQIGFTLVLGLVMDMVWAVGDFHAMADVVFARVSPLAWLRALFQAWGLGLVCATVAVLCAWPGTQTARRGLDSHRLGLRVMLVSAVACVLTAVALNGLTALLGLSLV